jgi:uncharacterized protein
MKLHADVPQGDNAISRHSAEGVIVNGSTWRQSIVVPWRGTVAAWGPPDVDGLTEAHFEALAAWSPELVILGSGARLRFPKPAVLKPLMARRIGFETMDTPAACRTYNVLLGEGRSVLAALLFQGPAGSRA